jgi:hypothetical protein
MSCCRQLCIDNCIEMLNFVAIEKEFELGLSTPNGDY